MNMAKSTNIQIHDFYQPLIYGETTVNRLTKVLKSTHPDCKSVPGFSDSDSDGDDPTGRYRLVQDIDCDEVYPGIFIGDKGTAKNKKYLERIGITYVLNAAEGKRYGYVNTNWEFYSDVPIKYLGLPIADVRSADISEYFHTAATFIEDALTSSGKVFIHCIMGISRSPTCVIAYLMIKRNMLAEEAIRLIRKRREIHPNPGFLQQLATLDNQLRRQRLLDSVGSS